MRDIFVAVVGNLLAVAFRAWLVQLLVGAVIEDIDLDVTVPGWWTFVLALTAIDLIRTNQNTTEGNSK